MRLGDISPLGAPLVVWSGIAYCDREEHEITLVTDGMTVAAWGSQYRAHVSRKGSVLTAQCAEERIPSGEVCTGEAEFRLDEPGWNASPEQIAWLVGEGEEIDDE